MVGYLRNLTWRDLRCSLAKVQLAYLHSEGKVSTAVSHESYPLVPRGGGWAYGLDWLQERSRAGGYAFGGQLSALVLVLDCFTACVWYACGMWLLATPRGSRQREANQAPALSIGKVR